jgi:hypothetical protein
VITDFVFAKPRGVTKGISFITDDREVSMADQRYLVSCQTPEISTQSVVAASCEVCGEHLVFTNSKGELAAIFLLEIVESWSVTYMSKCAPETFSAGWGSPAA